MTSNLSGSKSRYKNTQAYEKLGQGTAINMGLNSTSSFSFPDRQDIVTVVGACTNSQLCPTLQKTKKLNL